MTNQKSVSEQKGAAINAGKTCGNAYDEKWLAAREGARHSALPALEKRVQLYLNGRPAKRRSIFERELLSIAEGLYAVAVSVAGGGK